MLFLDYIGRLFIQCWTLYVSEWSFGNLSCKHTQATPCTLSRFSFDRYTSGLREGTWCFPQAAQRSRLYARKVLSKLCWCLPGASLGAKVQGIVSDDSVTLTFRANLSMPYLNKGSTCSGFPIVPGMERSSHSINVLLIHYSMYLVLNCFFIGFSFWST